MLAKIFLGKLAPFLYKIKDTLYLLCSCVCVCVYVFCAYFDIIITILLFVIWFFGVIYVEGGFCEYGGAWGGWKMERSTGGLILHLIMFTLFFYALVNSSNACENS